LGARALAAALVVAGFILAVPAAYAVATLSDEDLLRLVRIILVLALITLGGLLGGTGLALAWYSSKREG